MPHAAKIGERIPPVVLGRLIGDRLVDEPLERLFLGRRAVAVGVPGAFTPICTARHVPELIAQAPHLRAAGFNLLVCIAPNDPWVVAEWARQVDPTGELLFLSDGALDFARGIGASFVDRDHYLGERSRRYLLSTRNAVIDRFAMEANFLTISCTAPDMLLIDA